MIPETILLAKILSDTDDPIDLASPLTINVTRDEEENEFILSNKSYRLLAVADTLERAMRDIECGVLFLRDEYLREDDTNLTENARELKSRLQTLFYCDEK